MLISLFSLKSKAWPSSVLSIPAGIGANRVKRVFKPFACVGSRYRSAKLGFSEVSIMRFINTFSPYECQITNMLCSKIRFTSESKV